MRIVLNVINQKLLFLCILLQVLVVGCTVIDSHEEVLRTDSQVLKVDILEGDPAQQIGSYRNNSFEKTVRAQDGQTRIEGEGFVMGANGGYKVLTDITQVSENHFKVYVETQRPVLRKLFGGGVATVMKPFPYHVEATLSEPFRLDIYEKNANSNYSVQTIKRG